MFFCYRTVSLTLSTWISVLTSENWRDNDRNNLGSSLYLTQTLLSYHDNLIDEKRIKKLKVSLFSGFLLNWSFEGIRLCVCARQYSNAVYKYCCIAGCLIAWDALWKNVKSVYSMIKTAATHEVGLSLLWMHAIEFSILVHFHSY